MNSVAVVMCVFNEEEYLETAIKSILSQTYQFFTFYILNDCSTDRSKEIIDSFNDSRIMYRENESRIGLGKSLKILCQDLTEDYILRMDADDVALPERLEKLLKAANCNGYKLIGSVYFTITESGQRIGGKSRHLNDLECRNLIGLKSTIGHPTMLISTKYYHLCGGYSGITPASDYDLLTNFVVNGFKIGMLEEPLLEFRIKEKSTGRTNGYVQKKAFNYILKSRKKRLPIDVDKFDSKFSSSRYKLPKYMFSLSFRCKIFSDKLRLDGKKIPSFFFMFVSFCLSPIQAQFYCRIALFLLLKKLNRLGIKIKSL